VARSIRAAQVGKFASSLKSGKTKADENHTGENDEKPAACVLSFRDGEGLRGAARASGKMNVDPIEYRAHNEAV
jgi:hypothetical protein